MSKIYSFEKERRERSGISRQRNAVERRPRHRTEGRNGHPGFVRIGDVTAQIIKRLSE